MSDDYGNALILLLLLALPLSALAARRPPGRDLLRYAMAWGAILGIGLLVTHLFFT